MTDTTCPICGTQCRIAGDPSSVTRWYEPVVQAKLEQRIKDLEGALEELITVADLRGDTDLPHPADDPKTWTARMQTAWDEARAALADDPSPATEAREEEPATLCICGHPFSAHDVGGLHSGCCKLERVNGIIRRYCDCDAFKARKAQE